jgi:cytosine/uracil/thiamine/allantoin permease
MKHGNSGSTDRPTDRPTGPPGDSTHLSPVIVYEEALGMYGLALMRRVIACVWAGTRVYTLY